MVVPLSSHAAESRIDPNSVALITGPDLAKVNNVRRTSPFIVTPNLFQDPYGGVASRHGC